VATAAAPEHGAGGDGGALAGDAGSNGGGGFTPGGGGTQNAGRRWRLGAGCRGRAGGSAVGRPITTSVAAAAASTAVAEPTRRGGGGGSSYFGNAMNASTTKGQRVGNGEIKFSW
jgi:hypothetical protein